MSPQIHDDHQSQFASSNDSKDTCVCTAYRKVDESSSQNLPSSFVTNNSISELSATENITGAGTSQHALLFENATFYDDSNGNLILLSSPPVLDFSRLVSLSRFLHIKK